MKNQNRGIMGACEYSIATLQALKKDMMYTDSKTKPQVWAIGGIVSTLSANLLHICHEVYTNAAKSGEHDMKTELTEVKARFTEFMEQMINYE